ncbi:heat-inducible transcriptional repressor HrcA [Caldicoprobacter faecalis]|uniref:Heat-inducible transcription repressor HrcA n=1 Tax=Caldicoprobacter faecalis TaxID=937334 RepID=A0A1I5TAB2_9FIRM|nr:heat-inducible transcriptional repressor HrcA [Caldicoprobacter faecalis]SFP79366.1 heat-inducible transcription repressor HrcA [Caldicoprobacter faecalis]
MQLGKRKLQILQAVIDDYICSGEPVGSRTIAKKYGMGISPATIRNEMSDLEEMGYLHQPHTSAGRIPSDKAYRLYVDKLMKIRMLTAAEAEYIKKIYEQRTAEIEKVIEQVARILSDITNYTSVVLGPQLNKVLIKRIELIPVDRQYALLLVVTSAGIIKDTIIRIPADVDSGYLNRVSNMLTVHYRNKTFAEVDINSIQDVQKEMTRQKEFFNSLVDALTESIAQKEQTEVYLGGTTNIFNFPEYRDIRKAKAFLSLMEQKDLLYSLLSKFDKKGVTVVIGTENECEQMKECSIVMTTYSIGDKVLGTMGLIGPTRMEYSKAVSVVRYVGETVSKYLTSLFEE